jgi:protein-S-isoprenylcysteine O-methyltransferase Ste14
MAEDDVIIEHPNREKASSKAVRAVVVLLLLVSMFLLLVVTIGGWDFLQGARVMQALWIVAYAVLTVMVLRWSRGVLPLIAALAMIMLIFAAISAPGWFDRDGAGFAQPAVNADVLGLICVILLPVQALLIVFAMRGFSQAWNVEVERERGDQAVGRGPAPAAA